MAKSIRSKSKRKARAEFRRTIGAEAHKKNMEIIQQKLNETKNKGSLNSLEKLSNLMDVSRDDGNDNNEATAMTEGELGVDALETTTGSMPSMEKNLNLKGENKAPTKKSKRRRKHALASSRSKKATPDKAEGTKQRPRYFCKF